MDHFFSCANEYARIGLFGFLSLLLVIAGLYAAWLFLAGLFLNKVGEAHGPLAVTFMLGNSRGIGCVASILSVSYLAAIWHYWPQYMGLLPERSLCDAPAVSAKAPPAPAAPATPTPVATKKFESQPTPAPQLQPPAPASAAIVPDSSTTTTPSSQQVSTPASSDATIAATTDPEFKEADRKLNAAYKHAMGMLSTDEQAQLRTEQRAWIASRNAQCGKVEQPAPNFACLTDLSIKRTTKLNSM